MPKKMTNPAVSPVVLHAMQPLVVPAARIVHLVQQQGRCETHVGLIYSNSSNNKLAEARMGVDEPFGAQANLLLGSMAPF